MPGVPAQLQQPQWRRQEPPTGGHLMRRSLALLTPQDLISSSALPCHFLLLSQIRDSPDMQQSSTVH